MPIQPAHRQRSDRCPGLLRPYSADDGAIIRLRLPGGEAALPSLTALMAIAAAGAGFIQLTTRGNLQLRGLPEPLPAHVIDATMATGLVPTPTHERVRNILSSPLSGRWPRNAPDGPAAVADVRGIVSEVDGLLCSDPALGDLPGRFLFAVDDGRGDVLAEPYDVAYRALSANSGEVRLAGCRRGFPVTAGQAAGALIEVAQAFQRVRRASDPAPWHIRELDADLPGLPLTDLLPAPTGPPPALGALGSHAVAGLPLARLTPRALATLGWITDRVILTPWRSIIVPDAVDHLHDLEDAGLTISPHSGWAKVSACTGAPTCARARVDTEMVARDLVAAIDAQRVSLEDPVHLVACERQCGASAGVRNVLVDHESAADLTALLS